MTHTSSTMMPARSDPIDAAVWTELVPSWPALRRTMYDDLEELSFSATTDGGAAARETLHRRLLRLEALYYLICSARYDRVEFKRAYRSSLAQALDQASAPMAVRKYVWSRYAGLDRFDDALLVQVKEEAERICAELDADVLLVPTVPESEMTEQEESAMEQEFCAVGYSGGKVYLEEDFASEMLSSWNEPLLSSTAHAVETLHMLANYGARIQREWLASTVGHDPSAPACRSRAFAVDPRILEFVTGCYDARTGLFRDENSTQELYATSSAIAIFKSHLNLECAQRAETQEQLQRLFQDAPRVDYRAIRAAALQRLTAILDTNAWEEHRNALVELNHALRIIWNLSMDEAGGVRGVLGTEKLNQLTAFLLSCYRDREFGAPGAKAIRCGAFQMSPESVAPCLTACLAAFRIAQHAELDPMAGHAGLDRKQTELLEERLANCGPYVRACCSPAGGFGSSVRNAPDLLHTYMAVSLAYAARAKAAKSERWQRALDTWSYLDDECQRRLLDFLHSCSRRGGYSLFPEWKPSAYGTRLAFQTLTRLGRPVVDARNMADFVAQLLREREDGSAGFAGYAQPVSDVGVPWRTLGGVA